MVLVEIIETGQKIDVTNADITYIKQVSDFADITKANASYSWSFKIPKTPNNTQIFENLGISGDTSSVPYRRIYCRLTDNGTAIVSKGLLNIKETGKEYKAFIQEGIVEFFKDVKDDKIGETIDLSELNHENTVQNIINSFTQDTYRYIIADYNGAPLPNIEGVTNMNPTALVPSVNIQWLWDKIFDYYGWTYEMTDDFYDRWMTYPTALTYETAGAQEILNLSLTNFSHEQPSPILVPLNFDDGVIDPAYIQTIGSTEYQILSTGNYLLRWRANGSVEMRDYYGEIYSGVFRTYVRLNGQTIFTDFHQSDNPEFYEIQTTLQGGDVIEMVSAVYTQNLDAISWDTSIDLAEFLIASLGVQSVDFYSAFVKYKTADFFKEMMVRFSLTSFTDVDNRHIVFKTLNERLDADIIDWSDKYMRRESETYLYNSYARNNYLKHKYNDEDDDYHDGNLEVVNENLKAENDLYQSQTYAPLRGLTMFEGNASPPYYAPRLKMYDVEVKEEVIDEETGETALIANYKGLKDRFYIIKSSVRNDDLYILNQLVTQFPIADTSESTFDRVVSLRYNRVNSLLRGTRVHNIDLALSKFDVATLEIDKRYYFSQENAIYLMNKLRWKNGQINSGEFIKIVENPELENEIPSEDLPSSS